MGSPTPTAAWRRARQGFPVGDSQCREPRAGVARRNCRCRERRAGVPSGEGLRVRTPRRGPRAGTPPATGAQEVFPLAKGSFGRVPGPDRVGVPVRVPVPVLRSRPGTKCSLGRSQRWAGKEVDAGDAPHRRNRPTLPSRLW